jgi:diguanylate cyclase (GGDEF)-like protein
MTERVQNMELIHDLMLISSSTILGFIGIYSFKHRRVAGAYPLFIQMVLAIIWTLSSLMEINSTAFEVKILWRNLQQIGVFFIPLTNVFFAVEYTNQLRLKKYVYIAALIPITAVLLIFTNEYHHLMRTGYTLVDRGLPTKSLVVSSTAFGLLFIMGNYLLQLLTILILLEFTRKISNRLRVQVYLIILTIVITILLSWIRNTYFLQNGIYVPTAVLYIPSSITLFYSVFRYRPFNITPIARDKVFDIISEGIVVVDQEDNIVDVNSHVVNLLKSYMSVKGDIVGNKIKEVFKDFPAISEAFSSRQKEVKEIHIDNIKENCYMSIGVHPLTAKGQKGNLGTVFIIKDITQKKLYEMGLKARADRDALTGLLNRHGFSDVFDTLIHDINIESKTITVFMIDIDLFKRVNDTYGHINGDKVLQHFSGILKDILRAEDAIGRIGGEEFAVVLPDLDKNSAFIIAERIRKKVEESSLQIIEGKTINYTVSIGIADSEDSEISQDNLLHKADKALYTAKETSRNCTVIYSK